MHSVPHRLMFLGDRRIAWEVLRKLHTSPLSDAFDLRALVSCPDLNTHYTALRGNTDYCFISNRARADAAIADAIAREGITCLLSVQYNWILPPEILAAVNYQAFNLHNGKLPDYKGYNSVSHAILNGDTEYVSTLHWMDARVDSGDIAYTGVSPMHADDTAYSLYLRTVDTAVHCCTRLLTDIASGQPVARSPMPGYAGQFYARDTVARLADITDISDAPRSASIARAAFFPPFNVAYRYVGNEKHFVLPPGVTTELLGHLQKSPPNAPQYLTAKA